MRYISFLWIGLVCVLLGLPAQAKKLDIDDKALSGDDRKTLKSCGKGEAEACYQIAQVLADAGRHADVVMALSAAMPAGNAEALALYAASLAEVGRADDALASQAKACELDHGPSCLTVARDHAEQGRADEALSAWSKACTNGVAEGCSERAHALREALNIEQATLAFQKLCPAEPMACAHAGELMMVRGRLGEAAKAYQQACQDGSEAACLLPGRLLLLNEDPAAADKAYWAACEAGSEEACLELAALRLREDRVADAADAYGQTCDSCSETCVTWGDTLAGLGRHGDAAAAYGKACQEGSCSHGCAAAAKMADESGDEGAAAALRHTSCMTLEGEYGDVPARSDCHDGGVYFKNIGSKDKATKMLEFGCDAGDVRACKELLDVMRRKGTWKEEKGTMAQQCLDMGSNCLRGGLLHEAYREFATSGPMLSKSCDTGIARGCYAYADHLERGGHGKQAAAVRLETDGEPEPEAGEGSEPVEYSSIARQSTKNARGASTKMSDLQGKQITVLYLAGQWPESYMPVAYLDNLPGDYEEGQITVVVVADPRDDDVAIRLETKAIGESLAVRFGKLAALRRALGGGEQTSLWVFDAAGVGQAIDGPLIPGDDQALKAAIEAAQERSK